MKLSIKNLFLLALMLMSAGLAAALRPTINLADERPPINLQNMVPTAFGDWREQLQHSAQIINPQVQQVLDEIYTDVLTRTYVNSNGYRIMLSIAYGKSQSDALQLHKPEVCYPAQGFALLAKQRVTLDLVGRPTTATRLITTLGQRHEPVTYWTVVGDHVTTSQINKKLTEMRYSVQNRIPDGMLVRFSSIDPDTEKAYAIQAGFATELIGAIAPAIRSRFAGISDHQ